MPWNIVEKRDRAGRLVKAERVYVPPDLRGWDELIEAIDLDGPVAVALSTNRPELIPENYQPTPEQGLRLVHLVRVLLATNRELAEHSEYLAEKTARALQLVRGVQTTLTGLQDLANFRTVVEEGEADPYPE